MWKALLLLLLIALVFSQADSASSRTASPDQAQWHFNVYIDDKHVGDHVFEIEQREDRQVVKSTADFSYEILFVPLFRYEHEAVEHWRDGCLLSLDAKTNSNGKKLLVSGEAVDAGFRVDRPKDDAVLPSCVMTFAYWKPGILDAAKLLNPQTGDYLDVTVEEMGGDTMTVEGETIDATRYRLSADKLDLVLWYSADDRWLGLESVVAGGRIMRYELKPS